MLRSFASLGRQIRPANSLASFARAARNYSSPADSKVTFELDSSTFVGHLMEELPSTKIELEPKAAIDIYREMQGVRRLEMAADAAYKSKLIRGFCHLCTGQEAIPVGICSALSESDTVITSYRCHGFTYTMGLPPVKTLSELMGRKGGCSKGKGGSMHMYAKNFYGGNGIVGAQVPLGAGLALAHKYLDEKAVNVCLYGDGAANQGQVFESFNMAKLWDLPVIFVCENNKYGMGTSASRAAANTAYYTRGDSIPGILVNGMDVLAVREAIKFSREWAISGKGPLVLEMSTYRYGGHSMSDPGTTYRTREEVQHMRSTSDPITGFKSRLIEGGVATEEELKAIDKEIKKIIDAANAEAKASPEPDTASLFEDVYQSYNGVPNLRGRVVSETHYF
ncbi:hypothetical protein BB560_006400 [Smittium megazygosporum]|uniref:Pyruvate dehydrogenase E1 component subunit alpha n=1 Tax=Smittium megazygosporum TaxID=133381 RepID=A0A2T9Y6W6_9FUNG|nr:hypothetical protein BB560_006400 [Smittium megazygosporum]